MDLLLCVVEANAAAKALARVAAQSVHAVDDCSCIVDCCTKVLPAALSALEGAAFIAENRAGQAVECVQGCITSMVQLHAALEGLNGHDGEGVLGILMEHPASWLDTHRAFRGLTVQLVAISCVVRAAAQRGQADDSHEALQNSVKALLDTCDRAREAANLLGSDLPKFARAAVTAGWSAGRVHIALTASGDSSPYYYRRCDSCSAGGGPAGAGATGVLASASDALQEQHHQQQRMSLLQRLGKAAACSSPILRRGCGGSLATPDQLYTPGADGGGSGGGLEDAACSLVTRINGTILYDSEIDQLEQDRAYLCQRVAELRILCGGCSIADVAAATATASSSTVMANVQPSSSSSAAAAALLIQSEVLLAAVNCRLRALGERSDSCSGEATSWRQPLATAGATADRMCAGVNGVGGGGSIGGDMTVHARARVRTTSGQLVDPEGMYDDVRKRRTGLRWLPVCFVGA